VGQADVGRRGGAAQQVTLNGKVRPFPEGRAVVVTVHGFKRVRATA